MEVYIKPVKKVVLEGKRVVTIGDVCEVSAPPKAAADIGKLSLLRLNADKEKAYLITVMDIIAAIRRYDASCKVSNVGESEILLEARPVLKADNALLKWFKIVFVAVVLFVGSSTAIMSFHSDAQMPQVFKNYHRIFFGEETDNPVWIDLPYSIGLAVGIIVFFNHFAGHKMTMDPTPIEVEMSVYETDVTDTMLEVLNTQKSSDSKEGGA